MDLTRNSARLDFARVLALVVLVTPAFAQDVFTAGQNTTSNGSFPGTTVARRVNLTSSTGSGLVGILQFSSTSATSGFQTYGATYWPRYNAPSQAGGTVGVLGGNAERLFQKVDFTVWYRWGSSTSLPVYSFEWSSKQSIITWTRASPYAGSTFSTFTQPPFEITLTPGAASQVITSNEGQPPPPTYAEVYLVLENQTGADHTMRIGNEDLLLKPGYNLFPYYGEVDADGFPKGLPVGSFGLEQAPDGNNVLVGRLIRNDENSVVWGDPAPTAEVLGTPGNQTVKLPNGVTNDSRDYVPLPPGMTKGNNVPIPAGMTSGNPRLPSGVTPGSSGALPAGVISGGTVNLPAGVSAGTVQGNTSSGTAGTGNTGVTTEPVRTGGGDALSSDGLYSAGPGMGGLDAAGRAEGKSASQAFNTALTDGLGDLTAKGDEISGGLPSFWSAPGETGLGAKDASWLSTTLMLGDVEYDLEIPRSWIDLIRETVHWVLKICFVIAVLRLFTK